MTTTYPTPVATHGDPKIVDTGAATGRAVVLVPSRSQRNVWHTLLVNVTAHSAHHTTETSCPAGQLGRYCWHIEAALEACRAAGLLWVDETPEWVRTQDVRWKTTRSLIDGKDELA